MPSATPAMRLLVLGLWLLTKPAYAVETAETSPACESDPECQRLLDQGMELYDQGRFLDAYQRLLKAYERQNDPTLLYNLGRALHKAGRAREAIKYYQLFLDAGAAGDAEQRRKAEQYLVQARKEAAQPSMAPPFAQTVPLETSRGLTTPLPAQSLPTDSPSRAAEPPPVQGTEVVKAKANEQFQSDSGLTRPDAKPRSTPRRAWVWGLVGGIAAAATVVGVAVGLTIAWAPPADTRDLRWVSTPSP